MALLHTKQLFYGSLTTTGTPPATLYTVPTGYRTVVRGYIGRSAYSGGTASLLLYVNGSLIYQRTFAASESFDKDFRFVLEPGDVLGGRFGNAAGIILLVSGSIYTI